MNIVFITEFEIEHFEGAASIRIGELAKAITFNSDNKVFITSLLADNTNARKKIDEKNEIFIIGKEKSKKRNFLLKKYFSTRRKQNELFKICEKFKDEKSNTIFIIYDSLSSFYDEFFTILKIKQYGFKVILDKNELSLGIVLNYNEQFGIRSLFLKLLQPIHILNAFLTDELVRLYDGLIVISSFLEKFANKRGAKNVIKIPILYPEIEYFDGEYSEINKLKIGYFGTINFKRDQVINILEAVKILKINYNVDIMLSLTGTGTKNTIYKLRRYIEKNKLQKNIQYYGFLDKSDLQELQKKQNILIVLRKKNLQGKASFATKLANYMHLGKIVVASNISDNYKYIKDNDNGFLLNDNNPRTIVNKILEIIKFDSKKIATISSAARMTALTHFHFKNYSDRIRIFLLKL